MNNRELASIILVVGGILWALSSTGIRQSFWQVLRALMAWKILVSLLALTIWTAVAVVLAYHWGLWTPDLTYATVLWYFTGAFGWIMNVRDAGSPDFIRSRIRNLLTIGVLLEFFVNLYVFPLIVELVLQLILIVLALMTAVSDSAPEYAPVQRVLNGVMVIAGLGLIGFTTWELATSWQSVGVRAVGRQYFLPVWLTVWTLPFVYGYVLVSGYEVLFQRLRFHRQAHTLPTFVTLGLLSKLGLSRTRVHGLGGQGLVQVGQAQSFGEIQRAVEAYEASERAEQQSKRMARMRLVHYAGAPGRRADGRLLDRREFKETKDALEWIATCHEGWYRRGNRYRKDLMDALSDLTSHGLPAEHEVTMHVRRDGQAWYAYRQTTTGHWFGIGVTRPGIIRWYFDGPLAPTGFPSREGGWSREVDEMRREWLPEDPT